VNVLETDIPDVKVLSPERFGDDRGFFSETYNRRALAEAGLELDFVQDNDSLSAEPGTVRGLHFQIPPFAQHKLVRVVRGAILDVAVDLRRGSTTRGRHVAVRISAENWNQVLVPEGFAHGFCTLEPDTHIVYKVTSHYSPQHDKGLLWNDPALGIQWPVSAGEAVLSQRDTKWPRLADLADYFE
jgi:dTDP-4-dehydrorhamnose 3,5-epimerase